MELIGFSGRMGSGKSSLAKEVKKELEALGYKVKITNYAGALKEDITSLIREFKSAINRKEEELVLVKFGIKYSSKERDIIREVLKRCSEEDTGYSKNENVRTLLQTYGTDVKRKENENYWIDRLAQSLDKNLDFVLIDDVRFENEAEFIVNNSGFIFYLDVLEETVLKRLKQRDNHTPNKNLLSHASESLLISEDLLIRLDGNKSLEHLKERVLEDIFFERQPAMRVGDLLEILKDVDKDSLVKVGKFDLNNKDTFIELMLEHEDVFIPRDKEILDVCLSIDKKLILFGKSSKHGK